MVAPGVGAAIEANAKIEAKKKYFDIRSISKEVRWHLRRLGKITGSRFTDIKLIETKISKSKKNAEIADWLIETDERKEVVNKFLQENSILQVSDLSKDELKKLVDLAPGVVSFSKGAMTYMNELLAECRLNENLLANPQGIPFWFSARAASMDWGHKWEPVAARHYAKHMKANTVDVETKFLEGSNNLIAASSDIYIKLKRKKVAVGEIKSPWNRSKHSTALNAVIDVEGLEFKEHDLYFSEAPELDGLIIPLYDESYFEQFLGNMLIHDAEYCDFISFDPRLKSAKDKMFVIRLQRSKYQHNIDNLEMRLNKFKELYLEKADNYNLVIPNYI